MGAAYGLRAGKGAWPSGYNYDMWRLTASRVCAALAVLALLCPAQSTPDIRSSYYRGRPVTYQVIDGLAVYQGDIILGTAEELEAARTAGGRQIKAMVIDSPSRLWPAGVIPYTIDADLPSQQRVLDAVAHWNTRTPIRLVPHTTESNWVHFRHTPGTGVCSSSMGMVGRGQQFINLDTGCGVKQTIHEIGHTVGLWHEQSRTDRDRFVEVRYQNIDKRYAYNFDQELSSGTDSGSYDLGSIMHYGPDSFSRNGRPTLETIPVGIPIGVAVELSAGDIDAVKRLYGQAVESTTIATNPPGLEVVVDGTSYFAPVSFEWAPASRHTIEAVSPQGAGSLRFAFGCWSDSGAQSHVITASPEVTVFTASFVQQYRLTARVSPDGAGSIRMTPQAEDGYYAARSELEIEGAPESGYAFLRWSGFQTGSENPKRTIVRTSGTLSAAFTSGAVTTVTSEPPGRRIVVDDGYYTAPYNFEWTAGSTHTLFVASPQAAEPARYLFQSWENGETGSRTVTASSGPATYTARFTTQHLLSAGVNSLLGGSLSVNPKAADGYYDRGSTVEFTANASPAYRLDYWTGDVGGRSNPVSLTVVDQTAVTAVFARNSNAPLTAVNAASYEYGGLAPGQIIAIFGTGLGPETPQLLQLDGSGKVKTELGDTRILFDGEPAPLVSVQAGQAGAVVPYSVAGRASTIMQVERQGVATQALQFPVAASAPGIFAADMSGRGPGAILNEDGVTLNSPQNPAPRGSIVVLYATGAGQTIPPGVSGSVPVSALPKPELPVYVTIGGASAEVLYAGAAPYFVSGALQVNVRVPRNIDPGDYVPVVLTVGKNSSLPAVTLAVR